MTKNIEDVRHFWDHNPLYAGEFDTAVGSKAWFDQLVAVKLKDVFCSDLSCWVPEDLDGKKVLDVGCGPGFWLRFFAEKHPKYYAIDISPRTIELAKKHRDFYGIEADLQVGNAEQIPFPDRAFDYVISEGVIHHTPDTQACINEIYRVLKPGGSAAVGFYYKSFLLRNPWIFQGVLKLMKLFGVGLKGRGRDQMSDSDSPDEFVRMYDGADNPIGKAYTVPELREMFSQFSEVKFSRYFFPVRAFRVPVPSPIHKFLQSVFGLMILVRVKKS